MSNFLTLPVGSAFQVEAALNRTTWNGPCTLPSDVWRELIQEPESLLNYSQVSTIGQDVEGYAMLSALLVQASIFSGDEHQADSPEQAMDRAVIADALNDRQLDLIAELGE